MRVVRENLLGFWQHVAARENGVIALLDRRRGPDRLQPLRPGERVRGDRVPEPGHVEEPGDPVGVAALQDAYDIRGDTDLEPVQSWPCRERVEGVRDQMLAPARGARRPTNLH